jgi:hypothetical protein
LPSSISKKQLMRCREDRKGPPADAPPELVQERIAHLRAHREKKGSGRDRIGADPVDDGGIGDAIRGEEVRVLGR